MSTQDPQRSPHLPVGVVAQLLHILVFFLDAFVVGLEGVVERLIETLIDGGRVRRKVPLRRRAFAEMSRVYSGGI